MSFFQTAAAFAAEQAAPAAPAASQAPSGPLALIANPMTMLFLIFIIFYFLLIRPQQKKAKEQAEMLKKITRGDKVITTGGIYGTVMAETDAVLTLQVDEKVKIRVARNAIAGKTEE
jgi:preprotein translocase subunit YajC